MKIAGDFVGYLSFAGPFVVCKTDEDWLVGGARELSKVQPMN